jgi:hypothetical protein
MDLTVFNFPKIDGIQAVFSTYNTIPELLQEAKDRGFYYKRTKYNKLFSYLFFKGGKLTFKKGISEKEYFEPMLMYLQAFMRSYAPKHEDKEAICAMLLSELCEVEE